MNKKDQTLLKHIAQAILDKKGFNILVLDVEGISTLTDHFVIAEGTVDRHLRALARDIVELMKENGRVPYHIEGLQEADWIVLDFVDIVIHLFVAGLREKYALEEVWKAGKVVDVPLELPQEKQEEGWS